MAHSENLKVLPGSTRHYHSFPGGWLEHTLSVATKCLWLVDQYREQYADLTPPLNRDLVVAGAVPARNRPGHRIGTGQAPGEPAEKTVRGQLFGHVMLSRELVREAAKQVSEINAELLQLLEHMILTHLSRPEWGSPRLPVIPEGLILHYADDLDAKMEMYARCLRKDVSSGPFTERDPVLGRNLLKGREV